MGDDQTKRGPLLALIASVLFGVSPVFAKLIIGNMSPVFLAGLLYLGSGVALLSVRFFQKQSVIQELQRLSVLHRWKFAGATVAGGILAPLCLTYGIQKGSAFEVSLLLNLESVTTTVIAWFIFREHVGKSVWAGKALLVLGGMAVSINASAHTGISISGLLVIGACLFWGMDNNLTRDIEELPATVLAGVKGLAAGTFNILLALALQHSDITVQQIGGAMLIGALSYGMSLVLFIEALRLIGTSRTSTYFAIGPFFGLMFSVLLLGDRPHLYQWVGALIMTTGLWVLYREYHEHRHYHRATTHRHRHTHDEHHQHVHENTDSAEPHDHVHTHEQDEHSHSHFPDIHHRHAH